jgi:prepilin-type N-terminal cleavage/methylation domain-containing protein
MDDEGFSLVEVIVAMAIFLIVSAAALGLIMTSLQTVRGNADRVYAAAVARGEVDYLRTLGSGAIPLGASTRTVSGAGGDFTVTRTATWVDAGVATNPCNVGPGVSPGKSYLRVQVEVVGEELDAPQRLDAIVYPSDTVPTQNTGTVTVVVVDASNAPVPGVTVTGSNGAGSTFQQVTGPDGCVFVPDLVVGASWLVTVSKPGYITEELNGEAQTVAVEELQNTPVDVVYSQPGSLTVTAGGGGFPVPEGMPFSLTPDTRNRAPSTFASYPVTVTGLWPDGYDTLFRGCLASGTGSARSAVVGAGETASLDLGGTRIELVGPEGDGVRAIPAAPCTNEYPLGAWDDTLLKQATLPAGTWTLRSAGVDVQVVLDDGLGQCSVSWDNPDAITQQEYDDLLADPDFNLTPEDLANLTILPEVSAPCPTAP